jgi:hypothetical protein
VKNHGITPKSKRIGKRARIRAIQKNLRRHGFRIAVDGIMGPQTRSARKAFNHGMSGKKWTRSNIDTAVRAPSGGGGGGGGAKGGGGGGGKNRRRNRSRSVTVRDPINPNQIAAAMTAAQFDPVIGELTRERDRREAQKTSNLADLERWYGAVGTSQEEHAAANAAAAAREAEDFHQSVGDIGHIFGGQANAGAGGAGGFGAAMEALLRGTGQAQSAFDERMSPIIAQAAAEAQTREQQASDTDIQDVANQLIEAQNSRGNAQIANLQQARRQAFEEMAQRQNMALAQKEFGLKATQLGFEMGQAQKTAKMTKWQKLHGDPGAMAGLRDDMMAPGFVVGKGGGLIMGPGKAINAMGDRLRGMGLNPVKNKGVRAFRDQVFKQILAQTHARGQWTKYQIRKGKLVHVPSGSVIYRF